MKNVLVGVVIGAVFSQLAGCGGGGGGETPGQLQDPIIEMGDTFDVDVEALRVRKAGGKGPRILETPIEVVPPSAERTNPERAAAGVAPARWELYATFEHGLRGSPTMKVDSVDAGTDDEIGEVAGAAGVTADAMLVGFPDTGRVYRVERPGLDLLKLRQLYIEKGRNQPVPGEAHDDIRVVDEPVARKAWFSDNEDNRTPRGVWEYSETTWPYRTISLSKPDGTGPDVQVDGACTGAFIGSQSLRHVITAAHCFWNDDGSYKDRDYVPRKDGCELFPGLPLANCDKSPYGQWDGWVWMMPQVFLDHCVGPVSPSDPRPRFDVNYDFCAAHDIAVQQAGPESGATFPGAMGFGSYSSGQLNNDFNVYQRGYPACFDETPLLRVPENCRLDTLYGDSQPCTFANFSGRRVWHSCDSSTGHSGSPFYLYDGGAYVAGVHSGTRRDPVATPFAGTRIDGQFYGWMLDFMNL